MESLTDPLLPHTVVARWRLRRGANVTARDVGAPVALTLPRTLAAGQAQESAAAIVVALPLGVALLAA